MKMNRYQYQLYLKEKRKHHRIADMIAQAFVFLCVLVLVTGIVIHYKNINLESILPTIQHKVKF